MTTLDDLIARLERASGPDRELDADVADATGFIEPRYKVRWPDHRRKYPKAPVWTTIPRYTASVDAALKLVPPGWSWRVASCCVSDDAWVQPDFNCPVHGERLRRELDQSVDWIEVTDVDLRPPGRPAIALCIAVLKARRATATDVARIESSLIDAPTGRQALEVADE